jgi:hypothetical protein
MSSISNKNGGPSGSGSEGPLHGPNITLWRSSWFHSPLPRKPTNASYRGVAFRIVCEWAIKPGVLALSTSEPTTNFDKNDNGIHLRR